MSQLTKITYSIRTVCNILDWMDPKAALPVVSEMFISGNFKNADQFKVATKTLIEHAPQEMVDLVLKKQQLHNKIKTKQGRLKKLKKSNQKLTPEKLASETEKAQKELNEATAQSKQIDAQLTKIVPKI